MHMDVTGQLMYVKTTVEVKAFTGPYTGKGLSQTHAQICEAYVKDVRSAVQNCCKAQLRDLKKKGYWPKVMTVDARNGSA